MSSTLNPPRTLARAWMKVCGRSFYSTIALAFWFVLIAAFPVRAQETNDQSNNNPPGVSFTVRLKAGKTQFYQGELITIEMLFSSKLPDQYQLYGGTYDRSGRFEVDGFHVEPANGIADPTAEYFRSARFGFLGGGLSPGPITLSEKPYIVERDLNELVRFDQPGHYRLYVTNSRVGKSISQGRSKQVESLPATSNTIDFEILRLNPNWEKQQIQEAIAAINDNAHDTRVACRTLRFMNSAAAESEMIRHYKAPCEGEFQLGLVGSPRRAAVIEAMETQLAAPDFPVTSNFVHTLSSLAFMNENPAPLPDYPADDPEKIKTWQALAQKLGDAFDDISARYSRTLAATVTRKEKAARAVTLNTLIEFASSNRDKKHRRGDAGIDQLVGLMPDLFLDLPADRQSSLLSNFWHQLAGPAMLPVLRQLVDKAPTPQDSREEVRSIALRRLYQLAPDEGRAIILREMRRTPPRIRNYVFDILPDAELPEVDEMLEARLAKSPAGQELEAVADYSHLIGRYATANSLSRVKPVAAKWIGKMACDPQASLLAYLLRVDPDYAAAAFEQGLAARGKGDTGCYRIQFEQVGRISTSPGLEEFAIQHLDDPDRAVAVQAIQFLCRRGSPAAEKPLWNLLERWHQQWQTRPEEVQPQIVNGMVAGEPAQLEVEIVRALIDAPGWFADSDKLTRIEELCLTPGSRAEVQSALHELDNHTIHISLGPSEDFPTFIQMGHFNAQRISALKEKLSHLPKGTHFVWECFSTDADSEARLFQEMKNFLIEHGMTLEKPEK
jgi:hypothetical protein